MKEAYRGLLFPIWLDIWRKWKLKLKEDQNQEVREEEEYENYSFEINIFF